MTDEEILQSDDFKEFVTEVFEMLHIETRAEQVFGDLFTALEEYKQDRGCLLEE